MSRLRYLQWTIIYTLIVCTTFFLSPIVSAQSENPAPRNLIIQGSSKAQETTDPKPESSATAEEPAANVGNGITLKAVQDQLEAVKKLELPEDQAKKLTDPLVKAVSLLQESQSYQAKAQNLIVDPQKIEQDVTALKKILAEDTSKLDELLKPYQFETKSTLESIDAKLDAAKQHLAELQQKLIEKENDLRAKETQMAFLEDRIVKNPMELATIDQRQAQHTLGRRIVERQPRLRIFDQDFKLKARVEVLNGLSAHADAHDFQWWFEKLCEVGGAGQVFLVHGEEDPAKSLAGLIDNLCDSEPIIPQRFDSYEV